MKTLLSGVRPANPMVRIPANDNEPPRGPLAGLAAFLFRLAA